MAARVLQGLGRRWGTLQAVAAGGLRAESTLAATAASSRSVDAPVQAPEASEDLLHSKIVAGVRDPVQRERLRAWADMPTGEKSELELFRLHNSSLDYQKGQMVLARVTQVDRKRLKLHTGLKPARLLRSELSPDCIVGTTRSDSTPRQPGEIRVGDVLSVLLEEGETPEGDSLVSGMQAAVHLRAQAVWKELEHCMLNKKTVKGRVLNHLTGGYAVGIAGLVAFCPTLYCHPQTARRVGELQEFKVMKMSKPRNNVMVADARVDVEGIQAASRARKSARPPPRGAPGPRPGRQETLRAGQELQQVLESPTTNAAAPA